MTSLMNMKKQGSRTFLSVRVDETKEACYNPLWFQNGKPIMFTKKTVLWGTLLGIFTACGIAHAQGEGDKYVLDSLKVLSAMRTVEYDIRIETLADGKEYSARGDYAEQVLPQADPNSFLRSMYRLDIYFWPNTPMANNTEPNQLTFVCPAPENGDDFRIEQRTSIEGVKKYRKIDLKKLEDRLKQTNSEMFFGQAGEVRNLGGLAGKIRQICRFYEFSVPTQENLQDEETIPTWKLTGTLKKIYHQDLLPQFGGLNTKGQYPADFPSDVEIWLGRHNDFPYKIRYLRRTSEKSEQKKLLFQESFHKVVLNGPPIPAARFAPLPIPEDVFSIPDETDAFIKELGL